MSTARLDRAGMTLIELVIAMVISGFMLSAALAFTVQQEKAFDLGTGRMNTLQNYRFAGNLLEQNLRAAGSGVPAGQPYLVFAGGDVISFNSDYATNDPNDPFAVYFDPAAETSEVNALTRADRTELPNTLFAYPDSTYREGESLSPAETITFFFAPDTTTERADDYALYRQVNHRAAEVVSRHLLATDGQPFFEYLEEIDPDTAASRVSWVPEDQLPLAHRAAVHLAPGDTGSVARVDRLRAVRVRFTSTNGRTGEREQRRAVERVIHLPNAGMEVVRTCGDEPQFSSAVTAQTTPTEIRVDVGWARAVDDGSGENDVVRYVIYRRKASEPGWGSAYASTTAGSAGPYLYVDTGVMPESTYVYAVAAQDCTPSLSALQVSAPATLPVDPGPTAPPAP